MNVKRILKKSFLFSPLHYLNYKRLYIKELMDLREYCKTGYSESLKKIEGSETGVCFIIGNGPSLRKEDLLLLHKKGIPCFGSNRIYNLYSAVKWRPKYYVCQDEKVMEQIYQDLPYAINNSEKAFVSLNNYSHSKELLNNPKTFFYFMRHCKNEGDIEVSTDISKGMHGGKTVTFAMMEIAAFMGYSEIYLLGVDHNYHLLNSKEGDRLSHFSGSKEIDPSHLYPVDYVAMNKAFEKFKEFSRLRNIKVYNATRGGHLEIFERVNFDTLYSEK